MSLLACGSSKRCSLHNTCMDVHVKIFSLGPIYRMHEKGFYPKNYRHFLVTHTYIYFILHIHTSIFFKIPKLPPHTFLFSPFLLSLHSSRPFFLCRKQVPISPPLFSNFSSILHSPLSPPIARKRHLRHL